MYTVDVVEISRPGLEGRGDGFYEVGGTRKRITGGTTYRSVSTS